MLAAHFEHALPPMMADDSMEISSDHGHNVDDIDIDIEFTAGDGDGGEDYMVDDTPMNTGFDESHNNEDFLTAADELMVDDTSVVDEMNDHHDGPLDLMIDDAAVTMFDETIEEPVAERTQPTSTLAAEFSQDLHIPGSENHDTPTLAVDESHGEEPSHGDQQVGSDVYESSVPLESTNDTVHADPVTSSLNAGSDSADKDVNLESDIGAEQGVLAQVSTGPQDSENSDTKLSSSLDASVPNTTTSPHGEETPEPTGENEICQPDEQTNITKTPPASNPDTAHIAQKQTTEYQNNTNGEPAPENTLVLPEVVIVWRSTEYSLFPKSEFDDPETFFLSDPNILEQPIGDFLQSIRDVIHEEIEEEAELCMAVEDLALEIEETSIHLRDYTLGQIIDVFNKLLENDMEDVRPLYVMLRARGNFSKRYDVCKSSAIDGKGLSEILVFRDETESQEDFAVNAENATFDGGLDTGADGGGYDEGHYNPSDILDGGSQNNQIENNQTSGSPHAYQETESWNNDNAAAAAKENDTKVSSSQHAGPQESLPNTDNSKVSDVVHTEEGTVASTHDEDDLIDYSDEETEEPNTKDHRSTSTAETRDAENQAQNVEEYEAINEEPQRRRSLSRTAEGNGALQPGNDEDQNAPKVENHVETEDFGDELDYEVDFKGQEDLVTNDITDESGKDRYDNDPLEEQYVVEVESAESGPQLDTQETSFQEIQEHEDNYEEGFELGDENPQNAEVGDFAALDYQQEEYNELHETGGAINDTTALLEFDDAAESSATVSADEPHQEDDFTNLDLDGEIANNEPANDIEPVVTLPDEDEIDYEDDGDTKDVDVTIVQPPTSTTPNGSTKRSISEVEFDEVTALGAQENKRSKS